MISDVKEIQDAIPKICVNEDDRSEVTAPEDPRSFLRLGCKFRECGQDGRSLSFGLSSPKLNRRLADPNYKPNISCNNCSCKNDSFVSRTYLSLDTEALLGSTTSLDSCYTSKSLGLLSEDSEYILISDRPSLPQSPTQRTSGRYFSYPRDLEPSENSMTRSVHSWGDLQSVAQRDEKIETILNLAHEEEKSLCAVPPRPNSFCDLSQIKKSCTEGYVDFCDINERIICSRNIDGETSRNRVRQWLSDMLSCNVDTPDDDNI